MMSPSATDTTHPQKLHIVAAMAAFAGGAAALIHEIVWMRLLALTMGATAPAVALVISVFFGGLAIGSAIAARLRIADARASRLYAFLELAIAVAGPGVTAILLILTKTAAPAWLGVALILPPTIAMGATLPVLCAAAGANATNASKLYLINTLGGAIGAAAAGFLILEFAGIRGAAGAACALNLLAAVAGTRVRRATDAPVAARDGEAESDAASGVAKGVLITAFAAGAAAIAGELILNRLLYQTLGGTTYAITATLVIFLSGLVAGGFAAARIRKPGNVIFVLGMTLFGASIALSFRLLDTLGALARSMIASDVQAHTTNAIESKGLLYSVLVAIPVLALPALTSGFLFPLFIRMHGGASKRSLGAVYAANTLGGIVASVVVTFLLVPAIGTVQSMVAAAMFTFLAAALLAQGAWKAAPLAAAALFLILQFIAPVNPGRFRLWLYDEFSPARAEAPAENATRPAKITETLLYHHEGSGATAAVFKRTMPDGREIIDFAINGKKEASSDFDAMRNQFVLGHLPALLAREARSALVVGLGAGVTAGAVAVHPEMNVTIAELSPEVVHATRHFGELNHHVLDRKNIKLIFEDGRRVLMETAQEVRAGRAAAFDIITSDPIHPWVAGAANLYTSDYFKLVRESLSKNGVAAHWLPLYEMGPDDAAAIFRSFAAAFENCNVWVTYAGDAVLIGSASKLVINSETLAARIRVPEVYQDLKSVKLEDPLRLLAGLCIPRSAIDALPGPMITDQNQYLEFHAARNLYKQYTVPGNIRFFAGLIPAAESLARDLGISGEPLPRYEALVLANRESMMARAAFDLEGESAASKITNAFVAEPDSDYLLYLADTRRFVNIWAANTRDDARFFVFSVLAARDARRAPGPERLDATSRLAAELKRRILQKPVDASVDRALRKQCATLLGELRRYAEAIEILEQMPVRSGGDATILRLLARLYEKAGRTEDAKLNLQKAARADLRGAPDEENINNARK